MLQFDCNNEMFAMLSNETTKSAGTTNQFSSIDMRLKSRQLASNCSQAGMDEWHWRWYVVVPTDANSWQAKRCAVFGSCAASIHVNIIGVLHISMETYEGQTIYFIFDRRNRLQRWQQPQLWSLQQLSTMIHRLSAPFVRRSALAARCSRISATSAHRAFGPAQFYHATPTRPVIF